MEKRTKNLKPTEVPDTIGSERFWLALLLLIVFIGALWVVSDSIFLIAFFTIGAIAYFWYGSVFPPQRTIQAYRVEGQLVEDKQITDKWTFLLKPFESTSLDMRFNQTLRSVKIKITGLTNDLWEVVCEGYLEYIPVDAPKLTGLENHEAQIGENLSIAAARAAVKPFEPYTAKELLHDKYKILNLICEAIEVKLETYKGPDDKNTIPEEYGIEILRVVIKDPDLPKEYFANASKKSIATMVGDATVEGNKKLQEAADILVAKGLDAKSAIELTQVEKGTSSRDERVYTVRLPGGTVLNKDSAASFASVMEKIGNVAEKFFGDGKSSAKKSDGKKSGGPKPDPKSKK
jgi:regulator of protease activity HflC (stomatin/prohibitin superfamily)